VAVVFAAGLVVATIGAAQPTVPGTAQREQATIMLAIDTSDSMKATDVSPSRLAAAVAAAKAFIADLPSTFSVGVVSADASPEVIVAPSTDHQAVQVALDRLATSPGTALGEAIFTALAALPAGSTPTTAPAGRPQGPGSEDPAKAPAARIVLLSDGKSTTGRSDEEAIGAAKAARVPVSTIAFGTDNASVESAGQTVQVAAGTYPERVVVSSSGTSSAPIVFSAAPGASVTLSGQANGFYISSKSWITITGFSIINTSDYGIAVSNSSHITLSNSHVSYSGQPVSGLTKYGIRFNNVTDSLI